MLTSTQTSAPTSPIAQVAEPIRPFPLTPSEFWDEYPHAVLEWSDIAPQSKFGRGAVALGLKCVPLPNGHLRAYTTLEELAMLIIWSWSH